MNDTLKYFYEKWNIKDENFNSPAKVWYSRYKILEAFRDLNFTSGVEVGTEHGVYAKRICNNNPQLKLYCVDPYVVFPYYNGQKEQEEVNTFYEAAKNRLSNFNCEILKMTSMEAVKQFEPNSLDFAFIDGNHTFEFVMNDIIYWSRIVKPGGVVYGHDLNPNSHVEIAMNAYATAYEIKPWFILHAGGKILDCWMFVRQEEDRVFDYTDKYKYDRSEKKE